MAGDRPGAANPCDPSRSALVARWLDLTRRVLPGMADDQRWPIRHDHCFMRVCLDEAMEAPWADVVRKPAIRHISDERLAAAVRIAEDIAAHPETLAPRNRASLRMRGHRTKSGGGD